MTSEEVEGTAVVNNEQRQRSPAPIKKPGKKPAPALERVLIADDEHLVAEGLAKSLRELNYHVVGTCPDGQQAVEWCRRDRPDMVLLDIRMARMNGIDAARIIYGDLGIPVVIISAYSDPEYTNASATVGVFGYLLKPVNRDDLRTTLAVAWSRHLSELEAKGIINQLTQRLEDRKTIEKAKWILVEHLSISESDAMRRLQKQARDNRRTLIEVARSIIENHDLFTGPSRT